MALIEGQIIQRLKEKGQTVMYKTLHKKTTDLAIPSIRAIVLSVLLSGPLYYLSFYQGHCIICPSIRAVVFSVFIDEK
jgi:hypothetical protein